MKTILPLLLLLLPVSTISSVTRNFHLETVLNQRKQPIYYIVNGTEKRTIKTYTPTKTGNLRCVETHDVYGEEYKMFALTKPLYKYCSVIFFDDKSKWPTVISRGYPYKRNMDTDIDEQFQNPSTMVVEIEKRLFDPKRMFVEGYREFLCKVEHCNVATATIDDFYKYNRYWALVGGKILKSTDRLGNSTVDAEGN